MNGWIGKLLRVNLTTGKCTPEALNPELAKNFIGGRGLGVKIFTDEVNPEIDPFSAENKIVIITGPLTGTGLPAGSGCSLVTKSPLTGGIATGRFGGYFGAELKFAGWDGIILEGKAKSPVYLSIDDDKVELHSASKLWGKTTAETEDAIKAQYEDNWRAMDTYVACIGPAGEKLVRIASVVCDKHHAAARSGIGAVMGSKNFKAIAVRGTRSVPVADPEGFNAASGVFLKKLRESPVMKAQGQMGTMNAQFHVNRRGALGAFNYQKSSFEGVAKTNARNILEQFLVKGISCFSCPVACIRQTAVKDPEFKGHGGGPEFESCSMLGPNCGVDNLAAIIKANYLCNELGMDTMSTGGTIACAMEMYEKGFLTKEETGCELKFGNAKALVETVEKLGRREGFGDQLAEGGYRFAVQRGHPEIFMGVKKQELTAWHPQAVQGEGLAEATSNTGGNHQRAEMYNIEQWGIPFKVEPLTTEGKAKWCAEKQNYIAAFDSTGVCALIGQARIEDTTHIALSKATGVEYTEQDMNFIGERIWNLERMFNLKAGLTGKDDTLPKRMLEVPLSEGPAKGYVSKVPEMLPEYYKSRGWDENGVPTAAKLKELGLA